MSANTSPTVQFSPAVTDFLKRALPSTLALINPSGVPQQTIMWFAHEDGAFLFSTTTDRVKYRNYQHDPRASLTIFDPENMWKWVIVSGNLAIDNRDPKAFYEGLAERYHTGERLAEWRRNTVFDRRTVLRLTPTRARTLGFPPG